MALTESISLYEILLRFGVDGKLAGAHAQYLTSIQKDGVTIAAQPGDAIPLSLVDDADKATLKAALGEAAEGLLLAKEEAERQVRDLTAENQAKDDNIQKLMGDVDTLTNTYTLELQTKDANIQEVLGQVERMKAQIAKAEAHIADLSVYEAMAGLTPYKPAEEPAPEA